MIKTDQTIVCKGFGNCMQAVLASLFEKELSETINVMELPDDAWHIPFMEWIDSVGYSYEGVMNACSSAEQNQRDLQDSEYCVGGFFYGVVPSKNFKSVTHAVIIDCNGLVVHDPNPDKKWLGVNIATSKDLIYWYQFKKV